MIDATTLTKLINDYGLGIALVVVVVLVLFMMIRNNQEKDKDFKKLTEKVIELQEKTIVSNEKLANNIAVNTEVTRKVDTHLEIQSRASEALVSSVNAVLSHVKK